MTATRSCSAPLRFEQVVDYLAGDLPAGEEAALEAHLFGCAACTAAAEQVRSLTGAIARFIPPVLSGAQLARLREAGLRIHETEVRAGEEAEVYFAPGLDLLLHTLVADPEQLAAAERVDLELFARGADGPLLSLEAVPFDRAAGTVAIACQRHYQGEFPDDLGFRVVAVRGSSRRPVAEYLIRHRWVPGL